jgi:hypothetical protein
MICRTTVERQKGRDQPFAGSVPERQTGRHLVQRAAVFGLAPSRSVGTRDRRIGAARGTRAQCGNPRTIAGTRRAHIPGRFGAAFSSLSFLRSFPFDKIKIDQSFICNLIEYESSQTSVGAIAGFGSSFWMATTAESAETQEQTTCVIKGCTEVHGFFYSAAAPGSEALR